MSFYNDVFRGFQFLSISCIKFQEYCFFEFYQLLGDFLKFVVFLSITLVPVLDQFSCSMLILITFLIVITLPNLLIVRASVTLLGFYDFMYQVYVLTFQDTRKSVSFNLQILLLCFELSW